MSKLRLQILEQLTLLGNASGCHQLPERSFFYKGRQFPVCARCTGVTIGQFTVLLLNLFGLRFKTKTYVLALLIMGFDWFVQYIGFLTSTNRRRLITGILGGFGVFGVYCNFFRYIMKYFGNSISRCSTKK